MVLSRNIAPFCFIFLFWIHSQFNLVEFFLVADFYVCNAWYFSTYQAIKANLHIHDDKLPTKFSHIKLNINGIKQKYSKVNKINDNDNTHNETSYNNNEKENGNKTKSQTRFECLMLSRWQRILYRFPILTAYIMSTSRQHACILLIPSVLSNWGQLWPFAAF